MSFELLVARPDPGGGADMARTEHTEQARRAAPKTNAPHDAKRHPQRNTNLHIFAYVPLSGRGFFSLSSALLNDFSHSAHTHVSTLYIATLRRALQRWSHSAAMPIDDPNSVSTSHRCVVCEREPSKTISKEMSDIYAYAKALERSVVIRRGTAATE